MAGEPLKLKVIILGDNPQNAALYWRPLGTGGFRKIPLQHVVRAVYTVSLPPAAVQSDFEYYLRAKAGGQSLRYPATSFNQTVIVAGE
jgi:hypothetical protein